MTTRFSLQKLLIVQFLFAAALAVWTVSPAVSAICLILVTAFSAALLFVHRDSWIRVSLKVSVALSVAVVVGAICDWCFKQSAVMPIAVTIATAVGWTLGGICARKLTTVAS